MAGQEGLVITRYVGKRLLHAIFVVWGVLTVVFIAGRTIGDPARLILGEMATTAQIAALREDLGLDEPVLAQYGSFLAGAVQGDFGLSYWQGVPALELVLGRLPATLLLAVTTFMVAIPLGMAIGALAAWKRETFVDRVANMVSLAGASVVDFWVALMLVVVVSVYLGLLPTSGFAGIGPASIPYMVLPIMTLAVRPIGRVAQVTRSSMVEELGSTYVKMARAKGTREQLVVGKHALKNSMIPIITLGGDELTSMVNGVIIIEVIFAWPGIGQLLVLAIERRDLPTIEAVVFVVTLMVIAINLTVDLAYGYLNPRIRYESATS